MMLYVLPPPAAAGPPSPWSTILCEDGQPSSASVVNSGAAGSQKELQPVNGSGRLTYKRNASNNRRVKAWLNAVQKNNRPPPPPRRKPSVDATTTGPEVRFRHAHRCRRRPNNPIWYRNTIRNELSCQFSYFVHVLFTRPVSFEFYDDIEY